MRTKCQLSTTSNLDATRIAPTPSNIRAMQIEFTPFNLQDTRIAPIASLVVPTPMYCSIQVRYQVNTKQGHPQSLELISQLPCTVSKVGIKQTVSFELFLKSRCFYTWELRR